MSHSHNHSDHAGSAKSHAHHSHGPTSSADMGWAFLWGIILNSVFIFTEIIFGVIAGSMALIADAIHNLSDVIGLVIAWFAMVIARKNPNSRYTYGYRSATILSVLISTTILFVAVGGIIWSAIDRIGSPVEVKSLVVMTVAAIGIFINSLSAWFLSRGKSDLNVRAAFLHLVADAAVSAGVVVGAIIMYFTGWSIIDPIITIIICAFILLNSWQVLREAVMLSLNAVPASVSTENLKTYLLQLPGVARIHDLHVWSYSTTDIALTVHLVMPNATGDDAFLHRVCQNLNERFNIGHATVQIERGEGEECLLMSDEVV